MPNSVEQEGVDRRTFMKLAGATVATAAGVKVFGPALREVGEQLSRVNMNNAINNADNEAPSLNNAVNELDAALARYHIEGESLRFDRQTDVDEMLPGLFEGQKEFSTLIHNIEMNDHSVERRGEKLAELIWDTVAKVHNNPDPDREPGNRRSRRTRKICGKGLPEQGLDHVVAYVTEVALDGGKTRTLSVLFGSRTSGEIVHITSMYDRRDFQKVLKRFRKKGLTGQNCGDHTIARELLDPGYLFE